MQEVYIQTRHEIKARAGDILVIDPDKQTVRVIGSIAAHPAALAPPEQLGLIGQPIEVPAAAAPPAPPTYTRAPRRLLNKRTSKKQDEDRQRVVDAVVQFTGEFEVRQVAAILYPGEYMAGKDHRLCAVRDDLRVIHAKGFIERTSQDPLRYRSTRTAAAPK